MKRLFAIMSLALASCSWENGDAPGGPPQTRAEYVSVDVVDHRTQGDGLELTDDLRSIRFVVMAGGGAYPNVEFNERRDLASADRASALAAVMKLSPTDKLVVAIANEPDTLRTILDGVRTLRELQAIELAAGSVLTPDHTAFKTGVSMPMSGSARVTADQLKPTAEGAAGSPVEIRLTRHFARVDVCLSTDAEHGIDLLEGSVITLSGAADKTVQREWSAATHVPAGTDHSLVCSFFVPERLCGADKPALDLALVTDQGPKSASVTLGIDAIERNHRYIIKGVVRRTLQLGFEVVEWEEALDKFPMGQYRLVVGGSTLTFAAGGGTRRIAVQTDHPGGWSVAEVPAGMNVRVVGGEAEVTSSGGPRRWSFLVRAGNLGKRIDVVQL